MSSDQTGRQLMSIIVTTDPEKFSAYFAGQQACSVFITDNSQAALAGLARGNCNYFFADYRSLEDKWTGQHFLRHMRGQADLKMVKVWLMADHWHDHQAQWAIKCGAVGMLERTPESIADLIAGTGERPNPACQQIEKELTYIDEIFGQFAGPMRQVHIEAARGALRLGSIQPRHEAYVQELASKFTLPDRRATFLAAVVQVLKKAG